MTECYRTLQITVTYCDYCEPDAAYSEKARPGVVPGSGHGQGWTWAIHLELELFIQKSQNFRMNLHEFASPVKDIPPLRLVITVCFWISGVSTSTEGG